MVSSAKDDTVPRLIKVRESTALGSNLSTPDTRTFLVVDDAIRRVSKVESWTGPGRQIELFIIEKITLFEQAYRLHILAADEHGRPFYIIRRTWHCGDLWRSKLLQTLCAPAPATVPPSPHGLYLMRGSIATKLRAAYTQLWIPFRHPHHRGQRVGLDYSIVVQQPDIVAVTASERISNTCIAPSGETQVGTCLYQHQANIRRRVN